MKPSKCLFAISRTLLCLGFLIAGLLGFISQGAENSPSAQKKDKSTAESDRDYAIRVAVEEVRLDAVVLDRRGRPVTDLTAEDFEIYQDGKLQKILSCVYITNQADESASPALPGIETRRDILLPAPILEREDVRRVLLFVIDDVSMSFENLHHARMSMKRFVERQMQPGDLVAIMRTGYGNSALQMFLSDKQQLLERIDTVGWSSNAGFTLVQEDFGMDTRENLFDSQLAALNYSVGALQDLPGRKTILMLSAQPTLPRELAKSAEELFDHNFENDYYYMYIEKFNQLADDALRAGVVVHFMDIRGLEAPFPDAPEGTTPFPGGGTTFASLSDRATDGLNPLPAKTGGIFLENRNFFVDGIGEVDNMLQGYYLLSYAPPETTFKSGKKSDFHKTEIKVKRRGAKVYTRDGFYNISDEDAAPLIVQDPLQDAIFSPFLHNDLSVNLASGYIDDPQKGYMLRSWIHLDAQDVNFVGKNGEGYFLSFETVCVTTDIQGYIPDSGLMHYRHEFQVEEANLPAVKKHGIRFSLLLPVEEPGSYYVRVAVKDRNSGKTGSAYQYLQIPDLKKDRLALSNIFVINSVEDAEWILSGETKESAQNGIVPVLQREEGSSPAFMSCLPGDQFQYMAVIYNAKSKKNEAPDLESQLVLYRDGSELFKSQPQPLNIDDSDRFLRVPIRGKLALGKAMREGDYVMQLLVTDKKRKKKDGFVSQTMSFKILPQ